MSQRDRNQNFRRFAHIFLAVGLAMCLGALPVIAQKQKIDEEYTAKIREFTTDPHFLTKYIDYLPASETVPTPLDVLGHIAGARDILTYTKDINRYLRALAEASPRVALFPGGTTEEGRERIYVVVSDEDTIANLEKYKAINAKLADPRKISDQEAAALIQDAKVMYWATGAMHSGETGSPEMLMELAYRLAVDEGEFIRTIRDNAIVLITPVLEVDGREKMVDLSMAPRKDPDGNYARRPLYWGKYVAHDNNRDNLGLALDLSHHLINNFLEWHPQVLHDLHESASHLYVSTGTGPYNAWLDPIVVDEWHMIAYQEVNEMTREGVPGVWTHGFYDGWAPNYGFYAANGHNAIGRFYETQGAGDGSTRVITTRGDRAWYRPNPPLPRTMWSLRNNVNLQGSGVQIAIHYVAANREKFMQNFYLKSQRSVAKAHNEGPAAYVFPGDEPRPGQVKRLLSLLQRQGVEIHRADSEIKVGEDTFPKGSYVVRMDQPYSRMADMMLDKQYFNTGDSRPYDDVGWTMGPLYNVTSSRITDTKVLEARMTLQKEIVVPGGVEALGGSGGVKAYLINHNADNPLATFRFKNAKLKMFAAEKAFEVEGRAFNAGTFIVKTEGNSGDLKEQLNKAGAKFGFTASAVSALPDVPMHAVSVPRVAVMHTWTSTQSEGWVRIALDELEIPYDYISVHEPRDNPRLRDKYDVILFGPSSGNALSIVQGLMGNKPQPWKKTEITPNCGIQDSTDDMRGGLELEGVMHLKKFIDDGGLLITLTSSSSLPIHFGLAQGVSIKQTQELWARGSVFKAEVADAASPIMYGYDKSFGVYFSNSPVFAQGSSGGRRFQGMGGSMTGRISGRGTEKDPDIPQGRAQDLGKQTIEEFQKQQKEERAQEERPAAKGAAQPSRARTVLRFTRKEDELLISGGLAGGNELAGAPAVVDCPLGKGHIVMFSINPMWRHQTHGSYFMVLNAMLHFDNLDVK
ncbi:MAG: M14 family zinc carboxypeptidase [Candidatus Aminicenantaceae bacterium]